MYFLLKVLTPGNQRKFAFWRPSIPTPKCAVF